MLNQLFYIFYIQISKYLHLRPIGLVEFRKKYCYVTQWDECATLKNVHNNKHT